MKILQRYFAVSIFQAVFFVLLAFLALQAFIDLTGELPKVGRNGYTIQYAFFYVLVLVATDAAEEDAHRRLMSMLADQIVTRLLAQAGSLPQ